MSNQHLLKQAKKKKNVCKDDISHIGKKGKHHEVSRFFLFLPLGSNTGQTLTKRIGKFSKCRHSCCIHSDCIASFVLKCIDEQSHCFGKQKKEPITDKVMRYSVVFDKYQERNVEDYWKTRLIQETKGNSGQVCVIHGKIRIYSFIRRAGLP